MSPPDELWRAIKFRIIFHSKYILLAKSTQYTQEGNPPKYIIWLSRCIISLIQKRPLCTIIGQAEEVKRINAPDWWEIAEWMWKRLGWKTAAWQRTKAVIQLEPVSEMSPKGISGQYAMRCRVEQRWINEPDSSSPSFNVPHNRDMTVWGADGNRSGQ